MGSDSSQHERKGENGRREGKGEGEKGREDGEQEVEGETHTLLYQVN